MIGRASGLLAQLFQEHHKGAACGLAARGSRRFQTANPGQFGCVSAFMRHKPHLHLLGELTSEISPEDGNDPHAILRIHARKKGGRKTHQLCGQVAEALHYALAAVCNDDVLRDMGVLAVQPAPDEARLLVTISPLLPGLHETTDVLGRLQLCLPRLRHEVAAAIHRKKVPELAFRVVQSEFRV